ncbi:glycosyltransferase family 4 protein [Micromonospora globbae]|uniref:Glycosyltransferase family 1 protein n=1 Tax=Micromonospora globbae TaxID=1894969 RepID=A0A420F1X5_9ACTN|nr:glycosyltransferase family 4 protein [Micromonospora globbae]RKF26974.1 glycosyltransferase family 1 protein [Micromonospora globbae]
MDDRLRVVLVGPLPPPMGGIARGVEMLRRAPQVRAEVDLRIVDTGLRWRSIHQTSTAARLLDGVRQLLRSAAVLTWRCLRGAPDVVHLRSSGGLGAVRDLVLVLIARTFRVPVIYQLHFGRVPDIAARRTGEWRVMRAALARAAVVVAIDRHTERAIVEALPHVRTVRLPNGFDPAVLPPAPAPTGPGRRVLYAGWVIPEKGVEDLLDAWRTLDTDGWTLQLSGSCDDEYRRTLRERYGDDAVVFTGELTHSALLREMAACDVFVLPSHTEGFPNVVVEAMALGRAVVATDVGAVADMLADGCGAVVPPRRPADLAGALDAVMRDEALRRATGERARAKALGEYRIDEVVAAVVRLWRSVASVDRPAARDLDHAGRLT